MKYRNKPVEIWQFTRENVKKDDNWIRKHKYGDYKIRLITQFAGEKLWLEIDTPDEKKQLNAWLGDYILRDSQGRLFVCKPDIFEAMYERVD